MDDYPGVPQYKNDLARTKWSLGDLYVQTKLGNPGPPLTEAAKIWEGLVELHPAVNEYQALLADCYNSLAGIYRFVDFKKAEEFGKNAVTARIKLATVHKDSPDDQVSLAKSYLALGDIYRTGGTVAKAEENYKQGQQILGVLIGKDAKLPRYQAELARIDNSLGLLYEKDMKQDKATASFEKAMSTWEKLVKDSAKSQLYVQDLSITCLNLVKVARAGKKFDDAVNWCNRALDALDVKDPRTPWPARARRSSPAFT